MQASPVSKHEAYHRDYQVGQFRKWSGSTNSRVHPTPPLTRHTCATRVHTNSQHLDWSRTAHHLANQLTTRESNLTQLAMAPKSHLWSPAAATGTRTHPAIATSPLCPGLFCQQALNHLKFELKSLAPTLKLHEPSTPSDDCDGAAAGTVWKGIPPQCLPSCDSAS